MKIKFLMLFYFLFFVISIFAQDLGKDYKVIPINKKVGEILYEDPCKSPLENYVARMYLWIDGKYDTVYSEMIDDIARQSGNKPYPQKAAENLLDSEIGQVVVYKDSIGLVFRKEKLASDYFLIGMSQWENGKWLATGEDICFAKNMNEAKQYIEKKSVAALGRLRQYYRTKTVSTDTLAFVNYLQQKGKNPKEYLLKKITDFPLVIYGEIHRRELSWNLLKNVVNTPNFTDICGTIFMELPYYNQSLFDKFLNNNILDTTLIFQILETEQQYGWQDKGEYEFIKDIWSINKKSKNKIRIIPVDFQANWNEIKTTEDFQNYWENKNDRDSTMAEIICKEMNPGDKRHSLFIVGLWHAKKSSPNKPVCAGTLLAEKLPKNTLFSITSHAMIGDNANWIGQVRYGLFDWVFEKNGNEPVAFDLKNNPFGKEPFDASQDVRFASHCGNYEDFYDGYVFLCPLKNEPYEYELSELYTDIFVEELKRRSVMSGSKEGWYDIPAEELTKDRIIEKIKSDKEKSGNTRYFEYFKVK